MTLTYPALFLSLFVETAIPTKANTSAVTGAYRQSLSILGHVNQLSLPICTIQQVIRPRRLRIHRPLVPQICGMMCTFSFPEPPFYSLSFRLIFEVISIKYSSIRSSASKTSSKGTKAAGGGVAAQDALLKRGISSLNIQDGGSDSSGRGNNASETGEQVVVFLVSHHMPLCHKWH
jgi:hypothetical protein